MVINNPLQFCVSSLYSRTLVRERGFGNLNSRNVLNSLPKNAKNRKDQSLNQHPSPLLPSPEVIWKFFKSFSVHEQCLQYFGHSHKQYQKQGEYSYFLEDSLENE